MPTRTSTRLTKTIIDQTKNGTQIWDSEVVGFGLRVTAAGAKSFVFQFRTIDRQQGKVVVGRFPAMTVEEARRTARALRVSVDQGGNPSADKRDRREGATLRDLADFYCEVYGPARPLRPNTILAARRLLDRFALPKFGTKKVVSLTQADICSITSDANKGASRYQANKLHAVLSKMFNLAIGQQLRTDNPCRGVEKRPENRRYDYLSEVQVGALLRACAVYDDQNAANAIRLLLYTGARRDEVLKAQWTQFDLAGGVWTKPSSHTKTKMVHRLELAPQTMTMLVSMREHADSPYLFPGRDRSKARTTIRRPWKQILENAKIGHFRPHDLRRTMASFMVSSGSDMQTVGNSLGHTQVQTTQRYAFVMNQVQRAGTARAVDMMVAAE